MLHFPAKQEQTVQKVWGGVWQGFDHLTKLESLKGEEVLQEGLRSYTLKSDLNCFLGQKWHSELK